MIETGKDLDDTIDHALEGAFRKSFMGRLMIALRDERDALRALVAGDITSRKAMVYDNDSKTRLANDHMDALNRSLAKVDDLLETVEIQKMEFDDIKDKYEIVMESNAELTALLTKRG